MKAPIAKFINNDFLNHLEIIVNNPDMRVIASAGVGSLANIPWASIVYDHYYGQKLGLELDYLFKSDMSGVYLSLKIFYYDELKEEYGESFDHDLNNKALSIRDFLKGKGLLSDDLVYDVDLVKEGKYSKIFTTGTIAAKYYDSTNIPSGYVLLDDLNRFLELNEIIENEYFADEKISLDNLEKRIKVENMDEKVSYYASFYDYLLKKGYLFDKETIENYLLSLKVKPFAILTGNSGTGKTKLSQLYAKYIAGINEDSLAEDEFESTDEYVTVKAKTNFSSWSNVGWTLNKDDFKGIIPISECEGTFDITVDGIPGKGAINLLVQLYYDKYNTDLIDFFKDLYEKDPKQSVDLKISTDTIKEFCSDSYIETNGSILLKQKSNASAYKDRQWFMAKEFFDYIPFSKGYTNCKIMVDKYESSARIRIAPKLTFRKNARIQEYLRENEGKLVDVEIKVDRFNFENFKPIWEQDSKEIDDNIENIYENYKIIPVGANWTENRNIVGYHNVITDKYTSTPAYELIQDACEDLKEPYFLILDEMNLSHVERYFADFLSAIESGENIPLYGAEDLQIPSNLFIIGTVNVDETTYMFSPKVLDRANVLEFKTHSAKSYMNGDIDMEAPDGDLLFLENPLMGSDIRDFGIIELRQFFDGVTADGADFWNLLSSEIDKFQSILSNSGFDFGFRVINEIVRFMVVAWEYEGSPEEFGNWARYFDAQIKQKMLPKLHGSEKVIGETLDLLFKACLIDENSVILTEETAKYYTSAKKLEEMRKVLRKQRYVSFIN